jgi:Ca-activated chloride channel family protein
MIVFLTDGLPTAGITETGLIADLVARANQDVAARLHVFGVGYDVNTHLLDRLAADNRGSITYVQPGENLEVVLSDFYGRIANPVLTDAQVSFEGMTVNNLHPQPLPDMFQGSSLLLTGQYQATGPTVTVRVRGQAGETQREYIYHFNLEQSGDYDFVPRLWATRRVGQLLDRIRVEGETPALVEEIRGLGLGYGLVTPYTTFVIQAQSDGAASAENMSLYGNLVDLGRESGQIAVQARVQNQLYQQTDQANLATGANIINNGQRSLAQVSNQNIDLSLLQTQQSVGDPITPGWIEDNIKIDRHVTFGSLAYFALASDPATRPYLQSGPNVVFAYQGEVIAVIDPENPPQEQSYAPPQNYQPGILSGVYNFIQQFWGNPGR